jgi:hypothetical protein
VEGVRVLEHEPRCPGGRAHEQQRAEHLQPGPARLERHREILVVGRVGDRRLEERLGRTRAPRARRQVAFVGLERRMAALAADHARRGRHRRANGPGGFGHGRRARVAIGLVDDVEERAQLLELTERAPGAAAMGHAIAARHAALDHPLLQGRQIAQAVRLALLGREHPLGHGGRRAHGHAGRCLRHGLRDARNRRRRLGAAEAARRRADPHGALT